VRDIDWLFKGPCLNHVCMLIDKHMA